MKEVHYTVGDLRFVLGSKQFRNLDGKRVTVNGEYVINVEFDPESDTVHIWTTGD